MEPMYKKLNTVTGKTIRQFDNLTIRQFDNLII